MAHGLKRAFRLSGKSDLPAYPGFIVILIAHDSLNLIFLPSKKKFFFPSEMAYWIVLTYTAITDNTSGNILLNSSKQHQPPVYDKPLKNLLIAK